MIKALFIKDIKLLLKDLKFQIFFLILVALFILSAISSSVTYKAQMAEFQKISDAHQKTVQNESSFRMMRMLSGTRYISVVDIPSPALLFSSYDNFHNWLTNGVMFYNPRFESYGSTDTEAFHLNWNFILGILSGFIMLIMSFEAISSEKRAGTFRLLSIHGFKRQAILWCKYLSNMLLYLIIIIPPALISIIVFFALTGTWQMSYMMQFLLIILLSIPFASFFVFLGIFISMAKNYRNAIVMIVFIWLLFVIIIPQSANIFGKMISPIKTSTEYSQLRSNAFSAEWNKWVEDHTQSVGGNQFLQDGLRAKAVYAADEKMNIVELQELDDNTRQLKAIENIALLSPFTQFEKITEVIFNKGSYLVEHQQITLKNTISQVRNLMLEQDSRDETSLHLYYSWAAFDVGGLYDGTTFSNQRFEHPNLLFVTNTPTDDILNKTMKIILRLLPILLLNLLLIMGSVVKLERLDIR